MARSAPRDDAALVGVGPDTGGNHNPKDDAPKTVAQTDEEQVPRRKGRRRYTVMPDLLVELGEVAA